MLDTSVVKLVTTDFSPKNQDVCHHASIVTDIITLLPVHYLAAMSLFCNFVARVTGHEFCYPSVHHIILVLSTT